jgi:predicted ATPase/DNA-binding winged helix-turn-helix (wHTH) protein
MPPPDLAYRFDRAEVRPAERRLLVDGAPAKLGARAFDVLLALIERRDRLVTKNELLDAVWPDLVVEENNLQVQVSTLRKLLGPQAVTTVPGRGYRFSAALDSGGAADPPAAFAPNDDPEAGAPAPRTNLPLSLPPLIGRDDDLAALGEMVDQHRLVTLVGAGGIGKTLLLQHLLDRRRRQYPHGVGWVDLAAISDGSMLASTLASALGVPLRASDPLDSIVEAVAPLALLLALDNAEHLLHDVARLAGRLLALAPGLRLVVTSQAPLRVANERLFRLDPLDLPPRSTELARARSYGALALFEDRAQAADRRFALDDGNVEQVARICRKLDGIALAIELAAARLRLLGLDGLEAALDSRLHVLGSGDRSAPERHQTLRAALQWSHGLLGEAERTVFRRLSVFSGNVDLPLLQEVVADEQMDEWGVLDALGSLVDRSLVAVVGDRPPRYGLLQSPRALAVEKLAEAAEADAVLARHAQAVAKRYQAAWSNRYSGRVLLDDWAADLDAIFPEALAAFRRACDRGDPAQAVAVGTTLLKRSFTLPRDEQVRLAEALQAHLEAPALTDTAVGRAWYELAVKHGDRAPRRAGELARRAARYLAKAGERAGQYLCAALEATVLARAGEQTAAAAIETMRSLELPGWPPHLLRLGAQAEASFALLEGDRQAAMRHLEQQHRHGLAEGNTDQGALVSLIDVQLASGQVEDALTAATALAAQLSGTRYEQNLAYARLNLTAAALRAGDLRLARATAAAAWPQAVHFGMQPWWLDYLTLIAAVEKRPRAAARLAGYADALYARDQNVREANEAMAAERASALIGQSLDRAEREALKAAGALLRDDEVPELAFGACDAGLRSAPGTA